MTITVHKKSARLHRKAKHRVLSEDRTQAVCSVCATRVQPTRFLTIPSLSKEICGGSKNPYKYCVLGILSKEKPGLFNPDFWCGRWDLNPYGLPYAPQTYASAYSATTAKFDCERYYNAEEGKSQHLICQKRGILLERDKRGCAAGRESAKGRAGEDAKLRAKRSSRDRLGRNPTHGGRYGKRKCRAKRSIRARHGRR